MIAFCQARIEIMNSNPDRVKAPAELFMPASPRPRPLLAAGGQPAILHGLACASVSTKPAKRKRTATQSTRWLVYTHDSRNSKDDFRCIVPKNTPHRIKGPYSMKRVYFIAA